MAQDTPEQTPEGRLLSEAVKASGRSARQFAANAGMSDTRWRQIIRGHQPDPKGGLMPVKAPPLTLARMAKAAGVTAEQLKEVGREDAAIVMPTLDADVERQGQMDRAGGDEIELIYASRTMNAEEKLRAIRMVLQLRAQADAEKAPPVKGEASAQQRQDANNGA